MAINTSIRAGRMVQMVSISWPSMMNLLNDFLTIIEIIKYKVRMIISVKIIIAWSWKNMMCSIDIEMLSWKDKANHLGIT